MPIEIKELIIRAEVDQGQSSSQRPASTTESSFDKAAIIKAAVEEVMRILKEKESR
jgi:hypothetical protein